jgi:dihydropteroate synthase
MHWGTNRSLDFSCRTLVMGIVNATPDSFYPGSRRQATDEAVEAVRTMLADGADIIDIGGESTRPGSDPVALEQEIERVIPVIEAVREFSNVTISIDTRRARVAEAALDVGADIINDISALRDDSGMGPLAAQRKCPVVLMHIRGTPQTMQQSPHYQDAVAEVVEELAARVEVAQTHGIGREKLIVDPGIGFGKRLEDNLLLLRHIRKIRDLGCPVLVGLSRKSFIDKLLNVPVGERLAASLAAEAYTIMQGAEIIRVHDVRESVHLVKMLSAIGSA